MLFISVIPILSTAYQMNYTGEAYATVYPSDSPASLSFSKGLSLMMVEWPDASLQISIPGYLSSPVTFVRNDGYSLFTFSNEALVTI